MDNKTITLPFIFSRAEIFRPFGLGYIVDSCQRFTTLSGTMGGPLIMMKVSYVTESFSWWGCRV